MTSDQVWRAIGKASFAVLGYVTPAGEPRSSGVVYKMIGRRLYVAVAPDSWKARHIAAHPTVSVTVTVRRGGVLSLVFPIPPATVSFHGNAAVYAAASPQARLRSRQLGALLPDERRETACLIEIIPEGDFLTYGVDVPLRKMRDPAIARARVRVGAVGTAARDQPPAGVGSPGRTSPDS